MKTLDRRARFWSLAGVAVVVAVAVIASVGGGKDNTTSREHTVGLRVSGTISQADISYDTTDGAGRPSSVSLAGQRLPWSTQLTVVGSLSGTVLTALAPADSFQGGITCTLTVDDRVVASVTADGGGGVSCPAARR